MAGHSKWAQIKHKKASTDAKRGKAFTKIVKEISVAARLGGGDPAGNPRLRVAIEKAREVNMPGENIKRAVMKGTGELPGVSYEEVLYEGYGSGGVAILIDVLTDNRNRTGPEIRHLLTKYGGSLGEVGCVAWMFEKKGYILIEKAKTDEDSLLSVALEAGAEDMKNDPREENYEIITAPETMERVKATLEASAMVPALAEVTMLPKTYVTLDEKQTSQVMRLVEALEDHDDVQNVYTNIDVSDEVVAQVEQ
ncbi:MAG: YebC/PmpR family DNA-binding transcriptional regulator [Nitrospirota bacterium]